MNRLSLKAVVYNPITNAFHSPTRQSFTWSKDVTARACPKCNTDQVNPDCTCGIYSSPNPAVLTEYARSRNSVYVVLNTFGWDDICLAPEDVGPGLVLRSWGAQIVMAVSTELNGQPLEPQRQLCMIKLLENFDITPYPWGMVKTIIKVNWNQPYLIVKDPYDPEQYKNL